MDPNRFQSVFLPMAKNPGQETHDPPAPAGYATGTNSIKKGQNNLPYSCDSSEWRDFPGMPGQGTHDPLHPIKEFYIYGYFNFFPYFQYLQVL